MKYRVASVQKTVKSDGWTPLHFAAFNGHTSAVEQLLKAGCVIDSRGNGGVYPLHFAAERGHSDVVKLLLSHGASVNLRNFERRTALHLACNHDAVVDLLLKAGALKDLQDKDGNTTLHLAAKYGFTRVVETLLKAGASCIIKDKNGKTPPEVEKKISYNSVSAFASILQLQTPINSTTSTNQPIDTNSHQPQEIITSDVAANDVKNDKLDRIKLAKLLSKIDADSVGKIVEYLDLGGDPNSVNEDGDTLLHVAVRANREDIVELLLESCNINATACNKDGVTPMTLAIKLRHRQIAKQIHTFTRPSISSFNVSDAAIQIDYNYSLGAGAFGCVFKGTVNDEEVAIKTAHRDNNAQEMLRQEILYMIKCRSPYIVEIVAKTMDPPKLALQYMDCGDLRKYLDAKRDGKPTAMNVTSLEVAWVVANALADLHHRSTLHRDLKSQNVLMSTKHYIKLGDLGISREFTHNTMTRGAGTPYWEAPKVLRGDRAWSSCVAPCSKDGSTPLHHAARFRMEASVKQLPKAGASIHSTTIDGEAPLHFDPNISTMTLLESLSYKKQQLEKSDAGETLSKATSFPSKAAISVIPPTSIALTVDEHKVLVQAIDDGTIAIVAEFINRGIDPNSRDDAGGTLLHLAIRAQQDSVIHLLLGVVGINVSARNQSNETPLILAIKLGQRRIANAIHASTRRSIAELDVPSSAIQFDFIRSLGAGTYGCVYRGIVGTEEVAVKTAHDGREDMLIQEISIMTKCQSHYLVDIVAVLGRDINRPMLALQYMDCGDLRHYLDAKSKGKPTSIDVTPLEVAWVVANALADLHHNSTIHRDLKSQNILLSTKHYIKLGDLGISREFTLGTMTQTGTPLWEAPEVLRGEHYDYAADMYSFGVILTELDTLQVPYSELNLTFWATAQKVKDGLLQPKLSCSCEPWLKRLAKQCLSFDPKNRPSAQNVVDILRPLVCHQDKPKATNA